MKNNSDIYIKNIEEKGRYIHIDSINNKVLLVFRPSDENKLLIISLDTSLCVEGIDEIDIPSNCKTIKITKTLIDNFGGEFFTGIVNFTDDSSKYFKFTLTNRSFILSDETNFYWADLTLPGLTITKYKQFKNTVYLIGNKTMEGDNVSEEVFIEYNLESKKNNQEIVFYSDLGDIYLESFSIDKENRIYLCGYIKIYDDNNVYQHDVPYINMLLK